MLLTFVALLKRWLAYQFLCEWRVFGLRRYSIVQKMLTSILTYCICEPALKCAIEVLVLDPPRVPIIIISLNWVFCLCFKGAKTGQPACPELIF